MFGSAQAILMFTAILSLAGCVASKSSTATITELKAESLPQKNFPGARAMHSAFWTGDGMLIWGGILGDEQGKAPDAGMIYYPESRRWMNIAKNNFGMRHHHAAVWTGSQLIVWGGIDAQGGIRTNTGLMYDGEDDEWFGVTNEAAPAPRSGHSAVWTGERMLVWGGESDNEVFADGGSYDLVQDSWEPIPADGAPAVRSWHTAVWTGSKMIVFGGINGDGPLGDGGIFDPVAKTWKKLSAKNAPAPRYSHTAVWTGKVMIVWGGHGPEDTYLGDGAVYDPAKDSWTKISSKGAPSPRELHTAVWTGKDMIIYGGHDGTAPQAVGGRYDPETQSWILIRESGKSSPPRYNHSAVWTGKEMLLYGGRTNGDQYITRKAGVLLRFGEAE